MLLSWHSLARLQAGCGLNLRAGFEPLLVGLEFQAELVVVDPQIAVAADRGRIGPNSHHFLGQHADINLVAAVVAKAIDADPAVEPSKKHDVGAASAAAAATTAAAAAASATSGAQSASTAAAAATTSSAWSTPATKA